MEKIKKIFLFLLVFIYFLSVRKLILSQTITLAPTSTDFYQNQDQEHNPGSILLDLFKIFFSMPLTQKSIQDEVKEMDNVPLSTGLLTQPVSPTPNIIVSPLPSLPVPSLPVIEGRQFSSLREIFNEVGAQTGVPPVIIEAVLQVEMPSVFRYTPEQIRQYSLPGNTIPNCRPNVCSATGPMQMTIGRDADNNPLCPKCCWKGSCLDTKGGCPNAWAAYGQGNPCNLKDSIAAAARKLKKDSRSTSATNWSQEETYRASYRYYGNCTVKYPRLGDRTYCEYVWWYYQTVQ